MLLLLLMMLMILMLMMLLSDGICTAPATRHDTFADVVVVVDDVDDLDVDDVVV